MSCKEYFNQNFHQCKPSEEIILENLAIRFGDIALMDALKECFAFGQKNIKAVIKRLEDKRAKQREKTF